MGLNETYKRLREKEGYVQEDVSKISGLSLRTVQRFESGNSEIGYKKLERLVEAINYKLTLKKED